MISNAPVAIKGDDLYLKSGFIGISTENCSETYFDNYLVEP